MNLRNLRALILVVLFFISIFATTYGQSGSTGLAMLKIGVGGRGAALGEAIIAEENGALAGYWNPASFSTSKNDIVFAHSSWLEGVSQEFMAVQFPSLNGFFVLSLQMQNVDDIEHRSSVPTSEPLSTFSEHEIVAGLTYGRKHSEALQWGVTAKYLAERHFSNSAQGVAFDAGVLYQPKAMENVRLAATVQNLGGMSALYQEATKLPALVRFGAQYQPKFQMMESAFSLYGAWTKIFDNINYTGFGVEAISKDVLALRLGYQLGRETQSISAGIGFEISRYQLDYAYVPFTYDLGNTHRFSISLAL